MLKRKQVERAFLGIIRLVKEESEGMDASEESTTAQKPKWDWELPSSIRAVLEELCKLVKSPQEPDQQEHVYSP